MIDILKAVHKTAKALRKHGAIDKISMRKFDVLCLSGVHDYTLEKVKALIAKNRLS